ncbi:hypothetical protein [Flexivirga oryzae]|uniref:Diadenosine tetraphosphate (Ap4A) HIT family hydrolase n=1 Tax=Flexivirga oryzae TaxID=1794944 RepID=A0A839N6T3_9MICO|nr:hypothetical protein [Flexivirga oryzae]MBB2893450.1 diadenosine tetraphosphate (Ap4A) HIT family hydrolase [Flexivirga oryzae]
MKTNTDDRPCLICSLEDAPESARVFRDELWAAETVAGYDVPGWFFLRARRHAEQITALEPAELAAFGQRARDLSAAMREATGAPAVYLLHFGENYGHFHAVMAARGSDVPPQLRGGKLLQLAPDALDTEASLALVPVVRTAYEQLAAQPTGGAR